MPTPRGKGERQKIRVTSVLESQLEIACMLKQVIASLYKQHKPKLRGREMRELECFLTQQVIRLSLRRAWLKVLV